MAASALLELTPGVLCVSTTDIFGCQHCGGPVLRNGGAEQAPLTYKMLVASPHL